MDQYKTAVVVIFCAVYLFLVLSKKYRARAIWIGIVAIYLFSRGRLRLVEMFLNVNWTVLGIFAGTLILAELFIESKVPVLLSDWIINRTRTVGMAMLWVCILSSLLSIAVENVATVLIVAPIAIALSKRINVSPVPFLIGISISSNLQGTATLIGDPPSMILAAQGIFDIKDGQLVHRVMNFFQFFWFHGKPSIFFAVQVGAVLSFAVLYLFYRRYKQSTDRVEVEHVTSWVPTILLSLMIVALAITTTIRFWMAGVVCMIAALVGVLWSARRDWSGTKTILKRYDYSTTAFLAGVFIIVHALQDAGVIQDIADYIHGTVGSSPVLAYIFVVWFSVLFSAVVDNVPYITAMLPVVADVSMRMGMPNNYLLAFGLLIGSCLGGNITHIGASANIVSIGILRREGHHVSFWDFAKIGLPFTIAATIGGSLFIWFFWGA
ncbi:MAG: TRAP transporter large permease subunit [Planctomycetes bacterium]|nr:TRAP transporter large permease subunit [Planctomycetota bacterium]